MAEPFDEQFSWTHEGLPISVILTRSGATAIAGVAHPTIRQVAELYCGELKSLVIEKIANDGLPKDRTIRITADDVV